MQDLSPLRRRPDGSLDTDFYMRRGRRQRSAAAFRMTAGPIRRSRSPAFRLARLIALIPFIPGQS